MEVLIGAACFSALGYYSYLMYNYFKVRLMTVPVYDIPESPILIVGFLWYYVHTCIIILCES